MRLKAAIFVDGEVAWKDPGEGGCGAVSCRGQFVPHLFGREPYRRRNDFGWCIREPIRKVIKEKKNWTLGVLAEPNTYNSFHFEHLNAINSALGGAANVKQRVTDGRYVGWDGVSKGKVTVEAEIVFAHPISYLPNYVGGIIGFVRDVLQRKNQPFGSLENYSQGARAGMADPHCMEIVGCCEPPYLEWLLTQTNWNLPRGGSFKEWWSATKGVYYQSDRLFHHEYAKHGLRKSEFRAWVREKYPEWWEKMAKRNGVEV
jgi:hypothetical protein